MTTDQIRTTTGAAPGGGVTEQYWTTVARTANLARNLTALADRYDAAGSADDARAAERRASVALMRATAEAGRELIRAMTPPALPLREQLEPSPPRRLHHPKGRDLQALPAAAAAKARDERAVPVPRVNRLRQLALAVVALATSR